MKIDTTTLTPWAEVNRILSNAKTITVTVGDDEHKGDADLSIDDHGNVTLAFPEEKKRSRRSRKDDD